MVCKKRTTLRVEFAGMGKAASRCFTDFLVEVELTMAFGLRGCICFVILLSNCKMKDRHLQSFGTLIEVLLNYLFSVVLQKN